MSSHYFTRMAKNTLIYGSGQIAARAITFLMLPWTTSYLAPEDYGILGISGIIALSVFGLYTLGFGVSLSREYGEATHLKQQAAVIWSGFLALIANVTFWTVLGILFSKPLSAVIFGNKEFHIYCSLTLISAAFSNAQLPFLTYLKIKERASLVVFITILEVIVNIGLVINFVFFNDMKCYGLLLAGLISQAIGFLLISLAGSLSLPFQFSLHAVKEMVRTGYPYIFGVAGTFLMQCASRWILQWYSGMDQVGLFFMGSNFGRLIELGVSAFTCAWAPFSINFVNKREEALTLFGKFISYYLIVVSGCVMFFFAFSRPVVHFMVQSAYQPVWTLVGITASSYALLGIYSIIGTCFIFNKKSIQQTGVEIAAGLSTILFSLLLIPLLGILGAAFATFLSYAVLIFISYIFSKKLLPIHYEKKRIITILLGFSLSALLTFIPISSILIYSIISTSVTIGYLCFLYNFCLHEDEKRKIRITLQRKPVAI